MRSKTVRHQLPTLAVLAAFIAFVLLVAAAGCSSAPTGAEELAGRYDLRSVDGRSLPDDRLGGAIAGELVLTAKGGARRVVQYATSGVPGPITIGAAGTYQRRGGAEITLRLVAEGSRIPPASGQVVNGVVQLPTITLKYPGPADAVVEEVYVRVP